MKSAKTKVLKRRIRKGLRNSLIASVNLLPLISVVLIAINPYITAYSVKLAQIERGYWAVGGEYLVPLVISVISILLFSAYLHLTDNRSEEPLITKRYTLKDREGNISVKEEDIYEAIIQLSKLEDEAENKGYYDEDPVEDVR